MDEHTLFIAIRQSGEILDILAAPREDKKKGARILSVVSVVGSAIAREADDAFYTWAGAEIAVACTAQLMCMYLIRIVYGLHQGDHRSGPLSSGHR